MFWTTITNESANIMSIKLQLLWIVGFFKLLP